MLKVELRECLGRAPLKLIRVETEDEFFNLYDAAVQDRDCPMRNERQALLRAYNRKALFAATANCRLLSSGAQSGMAEWLKTDSSRMQIPGFAWVNERGVCIMLWLRADVRRLGIGSFLVRSLGVKATESASSGSGWFWKYHNIRRECHITRLADRPASLGSENESRRPHLPWCSGADHCNSVPQRNARKPQRTEDGFVPDARERLTARAARFATERTHPRRRPDPLDYDEGEESQEREEREEREDKRRKVERESAFSTHGSDEDDRA